MQLLAGACGQRAGAAPGGQLQRLGRQPARGVDLRPGQARGPFSLAPDDLRYAARRSKEGLSEPEITRCLKRYAARETYRYLRPR